MSDTHRSVITVASYNIHKAQGLDGRVDLGRIAGVVEELEADLVGIQEIFRPQAETLARRLGLDMHMGVTLERAEGPYGNVVLTRFPAHGVWSPVVVRSEVALATLVSPTVRQAQ